MAIAQIAFVVGVLAAAAIIGTLLITLTTDIRLWPPGDERAKALLHWGFVGIFDICLLVVAVLDWNTWRLPYPESLIPGVVLSLVGGGFFVYSVRVMDSAETTGQTATELYTDGPYARSRNPQYVGMMIGLLGFVLLANAALVAVLCVLHVGWLVLLPFAEEPWLRDQFGDKYDQYCERVPRFLGRSSFREIS